MNTGLAGDKKMFGINSQAISQDSGAVSNYDQELPVGGEDLLAAGTTSDTGQTSQPQNDDSFNPAQMVQPSDNQSDPATNDDLIDIKKDALQQLTPLVGHLDQTPEEKFRTTMMLIQATDDKSLLRTAYDAALQIPAEKPRAQALLDVVNEINYFTHPEAQ